MPCSAGHPAGRNVDALRPAAGQVPGATRTHRRDRENSQPPKPAGVPNVRAVHVGVEAVRAFIDSSAFVSLYFSRYRSASFECLLDRSISRPPMNARSIFVVISSGSPSVTISVASLPFSSEPSLSATPSISAAESVIDRSAASRARPWAHARPARVGEVALVRRLVAAREAPLDARRLEARRQRVGVVVGGVVAARLPERPGHDHADPARLEDVGELRRVAAADDHRLEAAGASRSRRRRGSGRTPAR